TARLDEEGALEHEKDRQVVLRVARFVGQGLHEDIELVNHGETEARLELAWELEVDFADLMEVRGGKRQQQAPVERHWQAEAGGAGELRFEYRHPRLPRGSHFRFVGGASSPAYEEGKV